LTEVSNLLFDHDKELVPGAWKSFTRYCSRIDEVYVPTADLLPRPETIKLGITDSGLVALARKEVTVISDDFRLCGMINALGGTALNYNNLR
jgi:hypothetical protein